MTPVVSAHCSRPGVSYQRRLAGIAVGNIRPIASERGPWRVTDRRPYHCRWRSTVPRRCFGLRRQEALLVAIADLFDHIGAVLRAQKDFPSGALRVFLEEPGDRPCVIGDLQWISLSTVTFAVIGPPREVGKDRVHLVRDRVR